MKLNLDLILCKNRFMKLFTSTIISSKNDI